MTTPIKANRTGANVTSLGEFNPGDAIPLEHGGTGQVTLAGAKTALGIDDKVDKVAGKGLSEADFSDIEKTKLAGIAAGATANATDAQLRDRATHTGEQATSTITGLDATLAAKADLVTGKVPTSQLPDAVLGALSYQGTWNATTNTPTIPAAESGNKGHYYVVSVAGTTSINGEADWNIGDWIVSSGAVWSKVDNSDKVSSVAGKTGAVTLTPSDAGADPAGTAAAAVDAHEEAADPHPQYTSTAEAAAAAPVQSVAGKTGNVTLNPADIVGLRTHDNLFPNGSFRVWDTNKGQISFSANGYTCAQTTMHMGTGGTPALTVTRETWALGNADNIHNTRYWLKAAQSAAATATAPVPVKAYLESVLPTANKTVKVKVRASCAAGTVVVTPVFKQNFGTGGSPSADVDTACSPATITLTTTPTDFELTFVVPSVTGKTLGSADNDYAAVLFKTPVSATYTTNWFNLRVGFEAVDFTPALAGSDEERCRSYYETLGGTMGIDIIASMIATGAGNTFDIPFKFSQKRALGTATKVGTWEVVNCGQPTARAPGLATFSYYVVASAAGIVQVYTTTSSYFEISCRYPL